MGYGDIASASDENFSRKARMPFAPAPGFVSSATAGAASGVGSGACVVAVMALHYFGALSLWVLIGMVLGAGSLNVALGPWIVRKLGKDPRPVVIDEAAGQWISCLPILFINDDARWAGESLGGPWWWYVAAFFLFRVPPSSLSP